MSVGWNSKEWKYISNDMYLGGKKLSEIWLGGKKIYPSLQNTRGYLVGCCINNGNIYGVLRRRISSGNWDYVLVTIDNNRWVKYDDLPFKYSGSISAILSYHDKIHIVGNTTKTEDSRYHVYVYDDGEITQLQDKASSYDMRKLIYAFVYNDEMHFIGGKWGEAHYALDSNYNYVRCYFIYSDYASHYFWFESTYGPPIIYNGWIYLMNSNKPILGPVEAPNRLPRLTKWSVDEWIDIDESSIETIDDHWQTMQIYSYQGQINLFIELSQDPIDARQYVWDENSWVQKTSVNLPGEYFFHSLKIEYGGKLHMFSTPHTSEADFIKHYEYDGSMWVEKENMSILC